MNKNEVIVVNDHPEQFAAAPMPNRHISNHDQQDPSDYFELKKEQSDEIAKFPEGCRVVHSIQSTSDKESAGSGVLACFASVEAVSMYYPTRENAYKTTSPLAQSRFVLETELSFAPETPVWAAVVVTPGGSTSTYTSAIVISHDATAKTYTVVDGATFGKYSSIAENLVRYRTKDSVPPVLEKELLSTASGEESKQSGERRADNKNSGTCGGAMGHHDNYHSAHHEHVDGYQHHHHDDNHASRADPHSSSRARPPSDFSTPRQPKFVGDDNAVTHWSSEQAKNPNPPAYVTPTGSNEDSIYLDTVDASTMASSPYESYASSSPMKTPCRDKRKMFDDEQTSIARNRSKSSALSEQAQPYFGESSPLSKKARSDTQQSNYSMPHHNESITCRLYIPSWVELGAVRDMVKRTRKFLRVRYKRLDASMSEGLFKRNGAPAFIDITEFSQSVVWDCIETFMIDVSKCAEECYRSYLMYDLAFENPELSETCGDCAWMKIPCLGYKVAQWVGIIHLPYDDHTNRIGRMFIGQKGRTSNKLASKTGCKFEVTIDGPVPHIVVRSDSMQALEFGIHQAKQVLADLERRK